MHIFSQALIPLFTEPGESTLLATWEALAAVTGAIPKEMQPSYVRVVKDAVATAREKERRKRLPGPLLVAGFCLPKALAPVLPIYLQGVLQVRSHSALSTHTQHSHAALAVCSESSGPHEGGLIAGIGFTIRRFIAIPLD